MVLDCNLNYTDYLTNEIANPFYATLTVSSFDPCLAACTSDIQCLGVGYDSSLTTAQCLLSENNFPVTVSCKTCRFSGKSCDNSGSIVVNPTTMPQRHQMMLQPKTAIRHQMTPQLNTALRHQMV